MTAAARFARLLRKPNVARLCLASFINNTGDWLLFIALPIFLLQLTGSPLAASTAFVIELLATIAVGPFAGTLVDRLPRRTAVIAGSLAEAVGLLPLLAVHHARDVWIVYAVVAYESIVGSVTSTAIRVTVPDLLGEEDLVSGNSLLEITSHLARLVGASAGGALLAWWSMPAIVLVDVVSFLAVTFLFAPRLPAVRVHDEEDEDEGSGSFWSDLRQGLTMVRSDRRLWGSTAIAALAALSQGFFQISFVVFVLDILHGSAADVGILRGITAIGTFAGGLVLATAGDRFPAQRLVSVCLLSTAALTIIAWNGPLIGLPMAAYFVIFVLFGLPGVGTYVGVVTVIQIASPPSGRGRVFGFIGSVSNGLEALGLTIGGALLGVLRPQFVLNMQAVVLVVTGLVALYVLRPDPVRAPAAVEAEAP